MQNPRSMAKRIYIFNFAISKNFAKGYGITTWYISITYIYIYVCMNIYTYYPM